MCVRVGEADRQTNLQKDREPERQIDKSLTDAISHFPADASTFVDGEVERFKGDAISRQRRKWSALLPHASLQRTPVCVLVLRVHVR